jgi:hypothetical protein
MWFRYSQTARMKWGGAILLEPVAIIVTRDMELWNKPFAKHVQVTVLRHRTIKEKRPY